MPSMPQGEPTIPDMVKIIEDLRREVRALSRPALPEAKHDLKTDTIIFSRTGPLPVLGGAPG